MRSTKAADLGISTRGTNIKILAGTPEHANGISSNSPSTGRVTYTTIANTRLVVCLVNLAAQHLRVLDDQL